MVFKFNALKKPFDSGLKCLKPKKSKQIARKRRFVGNWNTFLSSKACSQKFQKKLQMYQNPWLSYDEKFWLATNQRIIINDQWVRLHSSVVCFGNFGPPFHGFVVN